MQRDLVIAARDGDLDAYSQLVRVAFPRLYGVANLILRDADRAQDAVQDALVLAWKHVHSLREPDAWDNEENVRVGDPAPRLEFDDSNEICEDEPAE